MHLRVKNIISVKWYEPYRAALMAASTAILEGVLQYAT